MITIFDLIRWMAALGFAIVVGSICNTHWGLVGAIAGGAVGLFVGTVIGNLPLVIAYALCNRTFKHRSTDKLKENLEQQYFASHLIIAELVGRGEPVEQFWPYVLSQVQSDSSDQREFGWNNLNTWFPRMAKQIEGFNPQASTEACRAILNTIESAEPDSSPLPS